MRNEGRRAAAAAADPFEWLQEPAAPPASQISSHLAPFCFFLPFNQVFFFPLSKRPQPQRADVIFLVILPPCGLILSLRQRCHGLIVNEPVFFQFFFSSQSLFSARAVEL